MAVAFVQDLPMTPEQSAALIEAMGLGGGPPPGQILHFDGAFNGGLRVVDVWESPEAFFAFAQEKLGPAMQKLGINIEIPEPQFFPVNALLK